MEFTLNQALIGSGLLIAGLIALCNIRSKQIGSVQSHGYAYTDEKGIDQFHFFYGSPEGQAKVDKLGHKKAGIPRIESHLDV